MLIALVAEQVSVTGLPGAGEVAGLAVKAEWMAEVRRIDDANKALLKEAAEALGYRLPVYPSHGNFLVIETGETRDVVMTPALMARYRQAFAAFQAEIAHAARQAGARCLHVDVAQPFDEVVMRVFRSGGFLR